MDINDNDETAGTAAADVQEPIIQSRNSDDANDGGASVASTDGSAEEGSSATGGETDTGSEIPEGAEIPIFPVSIRQVQEQRNFLLNYRNMVPPPILPGFKATIDVDSIYSIFTSLEDLTNAVGKKVDFSIPHNTNRLSACTSSRYKVDLRALPNPPLVRGVRPKSIPLECI